MKYNEKMWTAARSGRPALACCLRLCSSYCSRGVFGVPTRKSQVHLSFPAAQQQRFKALGSSEVHPARVSGIQLHSNHLSVDIDGHYLQVNFVWLRDHCRCSECYNHTTEQRNILVHHLDDIQVKAANVIDENLEVVWTDGHHTSINLDLILDASLHPQKPKGSGKILWNADLLCQAEIPNIGYNDIVRDDMALQDLLQSLLTYGVGFVKDAPPNLEGTQAVAERVSFIQQTMFGGMWSFTAEAKLGDTAFSNQALGAHTDTTYFSLPAGIQVFHCTAHKNGTGGKTLLVDGFHAAEELRKDDPEAFDILTAIRVPARYKENIGFRTDVQSFETILKVHPVSEDLEWIRYNHYDRGFVNTVPPNQVAQFYKALASLSAKIEDSSREFWIKLKPGTVLLIDNWRVLHGRSAFTGHREVCGCYLPRDDWLGRARMLGIL